MAKERAVYRGLVVEDDPDHRAIIEKALNRPSREVLKLLFAHDVREACRLLEIDRFDFILVDHRLPDGRGCDVIEQMEGRVLTTPIIALSADPDPAIALENFRVGVQEFMLKEEAFSGDALRRRVVQILANHKRRVLAAALERRREAMGIDQADEQLIVAARMDPLMRVLNRSAFNDVHADMHRRNEESRSSYTLCMIDLDRFKQYNDRYGHAAGDEVLTKVAEALQSSLRAEDCIARYGGEEIIVLLDGVDQTTVDSVAGRLCRRVASLEILHEENDDQGCVTVSIGAAVFHPGAGESMTQLFLRADRALYEAKRAGRNRVVADKERPADDASRSAA